MEFSEGAKVVRSLAAAVDAVEAAYTELAAARAAGSAAVKSLDREIDTKQRDAGALDARIASAAGRVGVAEGRARDEEARLAGLKEGVKEASAELSAARDQLNVLRAAVGGIKS